MRVALFSIAILSLAATARAEVVDSQPGGFEVREIVDIDARAAKVWDALGEIGAWWQSAHTYSGDAKNLSLDLKLGGCFCERLPGGGGVQHLQVVYVRPSQVVRLAGGLGPLQGTGADGHMTLALQDSAGHTAFTLTYDVGGYAKGGLAALAGPVDGVLSGQAARLKRYVETGKPD